MAENITTNESGATKDETLDVMSLIQNSEPATETVPEEQPVAEVKKTPLELMREEKEKNRGIEISKDEYDDGSVKPLKDHTQSEETEGGVNEALADMDNMIKVLENNPIKGGTITDPQQRIDIINKVSEIAEKEGTNTSGVDIRKEALGISASDDVDETTPEYAGEETEETPVAMTEEKSKLVNILIDKTGLGASIVLSDEERAKVDMASKIKITEIDTKTIQTETYKRHDDGSYNGVTREYQITSVSTPITLPASRFTARMKGLSFGEMGDIAVNPEHITYEQLNKKLSVIYHNMINPSIGEFSSYDDFLKNIAYTDIEMCMFGLACSTLPETDTITLHCTRRNCSKEYDVEYSPRSLIQFADMDERALRAIDDIMSAASPEDIKAQHEKSSVITTKGIRLPASGFIVEIGLASAYDYLHGIASLVLGDGLKERFPDDVNGTRSILASFLTFTRSVAIPNDEGGYDKFTGPEDIINALYDLKQDDFAIMVALLKKFGDAYAVPFAITDVKCPHCGSETKKVPLDIATLVFTKYQTLGNTEIDLDAIVII